MTTGERWEWITGYYGRAAVSDLGRIFCEAGGGLRTPYMDNRVLYVRLWDNGPKLNVARAVLTAFVGPSEGVAMHINGNDCRLANLRWGTRMEVARKANSVRTKTTGIILPPEARRIIREKLLNKKATYDELASWYGVSTRTIRRIEDE